MTVDWKAANLNIADLNSTDLNLACARACICADGGVDACVRTSTDACARVDTGSATNAGNVVGSIALGDAGTAAIAAMGDVKQLLFCKPSLNLKRA